MAKAQTSEQVLDDLRRFCNEFASRLIEPYFGQIAQPNSLTTTPKEVNDAVWGTIKLLPVEVAILDSPIVQRLRFIRQLGVVHWIYPGAIHTRFEHTLGVVHQVQQLITAINGASPIGLKPIDDKYAELLRLAALLHDIGHAIFSHISEHALIRSDSLRRALNRFAREKGLDKVQLSELVSYFVIGSNIFQNLMARVLASVPSQLTFSADVVANASLIATKLQNAIIGKAINDQVPLMHELISGPLDGDKLDYFVRDAKMAGIPAVLDISRLIQKITVEVLTQSNLPEKIGASVSSGHSSYYLFGLKWSGAAALDELHLARVLLYAKIYRHQKVLAAEAMVEAFFDTFIRSDRFSIVDVVRLAYQLTDDQLLWTDPKSLLERMELDFSSETDLLFVSDILERLRDRRLYVKALAVRASYPNDPWAGYDPQVKGLQRLVEDLANSEQSKVVRDLLIKEVKSIVELIPESVSGTFNLRLLSQSITITSKSRLSGGTEIDRSFVFHAGKPVTYRDISGVNRHAWADAYDFSTAPALIFCPKELAVPAYIGAEKLLREKYDVILPPSSIELSKQEPKNVDDLKRQLSNRGFYKGTYFDLRPKPERLARADVSTFLDQMSAKFEAFDEPQGVGGQRRPLSLRERIQYWVAQFQTSSDISCAMELLKKVRVLGRDDTRSALQDFIAKYPEFRGATILLLGELKDSSAIQGYYSQDVADILPRVVTVKEAAEKKIDTPVIFLDDFIGSGGQISDMLGNWFDDEGLKRSDLNEQRELFGDIEREYLRSRAVGFVFVAGWNDGIDAAKQACSQLGLNATVFAHLGDDLIPFAFDGALSACEPDEIDEFRTKCEAIGRDILQSSGVDAGKAKSRFLGYGNRAMLLVSRYNVPTQTITCLWRGGDMGDFHWQPLLSRRTKH